MARGERRQMPTSESIESANTPAPKAVKAMAAFSPRRPTKMVAPNTPSNLLTGDRAGGGGGEEAPSTSHTRGGAAAAPADVDGRGGERESGEAERERERRQDGDRAA